MAIQLVSFDDYLRYIGEPSVTNEAQTKSALRDAQAFADQYTDRSLRAYDGDDAAATTHTWTFSGPGRKQIYVPNPPIVSVTSISYWDSSTEDFTAVDSTTHTTVFQDSRINFREGYEFYEGVDNWKIIYVYGWTTVPRDLKLAIMQITQSFARAEIRDSNIKSEADGEQSFTYFEGQSTTVPKDATATLDRYKRMF